MPAQLEHGYLFITDGGTRVIGAIPPRCSRSREIGWDGGVYLCTLTPAHAGPHFNNRASTTGRECERRLLLPRRRYAITRVIRSANNGAPLASVCPSASPDTLAKLIRRNGDVKYTCTYTISSSLARSEIFSDLPEGRCIRERFRTKRRFKLRRKLN